MPMIDMPLEQLQAYYGKNPKPDDFDDFWDRSLAEVHALGVDHTIEKAAFQVPFAECADLYFNGVGGSKIHAQVLKPKGSDRKLPALLQFHGYSGSTGDWNMKLNYVAAGFCVVALDCRGQGGTSEDRGGVKGPTMYGQLIRGLDDEPGNLLFRQIMLDTVQLANIVMSFDDVNEEKVYAMGASQGGGLTLACAALEPRIQKLAPVYPFLSDYRRIWDMDLDKGAYIGLREYFRHFDPTHEREDEVFTKLGYIDIQHLAARIKGRVLMATGLLDTCCPPSTQFAVYNKIKSRKEIVLYPDFAHEHLPGFWDKVFHFFLEE